MEDFKRDIQLRRTFKFQLLQNPNYFGNLSELDLPDLPKAVLKKIGDTTYEELTCVGYNPDTDILTAIVEVKQVAGYSGGPCTDGSQEYVRFYLDYGDGVWVDHGATAFTAHDLGFKDDLCYAVSIKLGPKRRNCCDTKPVLPNVRAILSWSTEPPANQPNWHPVWGNRLERSIQIDPRNPFLCKFIDVFEKPGVQKIDPALIAQLKLAIEAQPSAPKPVATIGELTECGDQRDEMLVLRHAFPAIAKLAADKTDIAAFQALKATQIDLSKFDDFLLKPAFNTTYEELHCVGLDRDLSLLHGVVQIKRPGGYSGGLCKQGSREYIAFYIDFGAGWEYQGTTSVVVHDIPEIPKDGLWYQASLKVDLDDHKKKWCDTGRARIRGILSWAVPPPPNVPEFIPHWGDREDCWIEIRHLPKDVIPGLMTPFIEAIGNMPVDQINGAGFANGGSIGATFTADDSPFGGTILFAGLIFFPTSNNLEYRVMVKGPSDLVAQPWTQSFDVTVTTFPPLTTATVTQTAPGGWFEYIPQPGPPVSKSVAGNLLARFKAVEEGLHTVFLQIREQGTAVILASSATEAFFVDNTLPSVDVEITSGAGNCGKFTIGEVLVGTYSMEDLHSLSLSLTVTPQAEAAGGHLAITSVVPAAPLPPPLPGPTASNGLSYAALTLDTSGASGNWELDTTGMDACGYNIRIWGVDRTIVNSGGNGWPAGDIEGFCLDE